MAILSREGSTISVKRCHGLGNVIMLLPVLAKLAEGGRHVRLVTRPEWAGALRRLLPWLDVSDDRPRDVIDLDSATNALTPSGHRGDEFAVMLGVEGTLPPPRLDAPPEWSRPFLQWKGAIGFAPEAGHPSRQWPADYSATLARSLEGSPLILLGVSDSQPLACDLDMRGRLGLEELIGLLGVIRLMVCMDSGMLHLAAAVGLPTVCVFGGVEPEFRVHRRQRVLALQASLACCPCNKNETCEGRYDCISAVTPGAVLEAVRNAGGVLSRAVRRV